MYATEFQALITKLHRTTAQNRTGLSLISHDHVADLVDLVMRFWVATATGPLPETLLLKIGRPLQRAFAAVLLVPRAPRKKDSVHGALVPSSDGKCWPREADLFGGSTVGRRQQFSSLADSKTATSPESDTECTPFGTVVTRDRSSSELQLLPVSTHLPFALSSSWSHERLRPALCHHFLLTPAWGEVQGERTILATVQGESAWRKEKDESVGKNTRYLPHRLFSLGFTTTHDLEQF